jgi:hypothetical protein
MVFPYLYVPQRAGQPTLVFATAKEARRCVATCVVWSGREVRFVNSGQWIEDSSMQTACSSTLTNISKITKTCFQLKIHHGVTAFSPLTVQLITRATPPFHHCIGWFFFIFVVKVRLSLCPCHEDVWGSGGIHPPFLNSTPDGDEWLVSRTGRFAPGERASGTHWIERWVGPRAGQDAVESNPDSSVVLLIARRYTDWAVPARHMHNMYDKCKWFPKRVDLKVFEGFVFFQTPPKIEKMV